MLSAQQTLILDLKLISLNEWTFSCRKNQGNEN